MILDLFFFFEFLIINENSAFFLPQGGDTSMTILLVIA